MMADLMAIDSFDLAEIYFTHIVGGKARGRDGVAPDALASSAFKTCEVIARKMREGSYVFTQYREKLNLKGAGRLPRVISIPTVRDRIVLKAMANFLADVFPELRQELAQQKIISIREALGSNVYCEVIHADIENFYPTVTHDHVMTGLAERITNPDTLKIFRDAITTPTVADGAGRQPSSAVGVPQGLAVSNMLAEIVMGPVDRAMRSRPNIKYFRYVDDILILNRTKTPQVVLQDLRSVLKGRGLSLNEAKSGSGLIESTFEYLGYKFSGEKISVRGSNVAKIETSLARLFTKYKYESKRIGGDRALSRCIFYVNLRITGCIEGKTARGWLQYFRQMNDEELVNRLDWVICRLQNRFDVPADVKLKTFTKAYWAVKHPGKGRIDYVPNFDQWGVDRKRDLLIEVEGLTDAYSLRDEEIEGKFNRLIKASIRDLELDLGSLS